MEYLLTVSIVVHGNYKYIAPALQSVFQTTSLPCQVIVIINTGDDPLVDELRLHFPQVEFVVNQHPHGFASNHNYILQRAVTPYVAILNDDILLHGSVLDQLVQYLEQHPQVAVIGPRLNNPDGSQQVSVYSDPSLLRSLYRISGLAQFTSQNSRIRHLLQRSGVLRGVKVESLHFDNRVRSVEIIKGAAMVVRQSAVKTVGLMDETTLMYGEEPDWHLRFRQAGWQVIYFPEVEITHFGLGQANLKLRGRILIEDRRAILYYYVKHHPQWQARLMQTAIISTHLVWSMIWFPFNRLRSRDHLKVVQMARSVQSWAGRGSS
jgi:hypothetical protein